jgi:hypothetical protein
MTEGNDKKIIEEIRKNSITFQDEYFVPENLRHNVVKFCSFAKTISGNGTWFSLPKSVGERLFGITNFYIMPPPCQWEQQTIEFQLKFTHEVLQKIREHSILDTTYLIPKRILNDKLIDFIKNDLIMKQEEVIIDSKTNEKHVQVTRSINLFCEDDFWLGLPKSYGVHLFGLPNKVKLPEYSQPENPSSYKFENGYSPIHQTFAIEKLWSVLDKEMGSLLFMDCGLGKCLSPHTLVLKNDLSKIRVDQLKPGDYLLGADWQPVQIVETNFGLGPTFRVVNVANNETLFVCNDEHIIVHTFDNLHNVDDLDDIDLIETRAKNLVGQKFCQIRYKNESEWEYILSSVEPFESVGKYCGFTLESSSDGRFLLSTGIISHNTATLLRHHATRKPPAKRIIVVQKEVLFRQMEKAARRFLPDMKIGYIWGKTEEICDLTLAMERTLVKRYQKDPSKLLKLLSNFHGAIIDEAHHCSAPEFAKILVNNPFREIVCVTATRSRKDNGHLFWPKLVGPGSVSIFRVPQEITYITLQHSIKVEEKKTRRCVGRGKWVECVNTANVVSQLAENDEMIEYCIQVAWKVYKMGRWPLGLGERTEQSKKIYEGLRKLLEAEGVNIDENLGLLIGGYDPKPKQPGEKRQKGDNKRKRIAQELEKHQTRGLLVGNFQMAQEALDLPYHDTLILFGDITSMQQPEGRIQRIKLNDECDDSGEKPPHVPKPRWIIDIYSQGGYLRRCFEKRKRFFVNDRKYKRLNFLIDDWLKNEKSDFSQSSLEDDSEDYEFSQSYNNKKRPVHIFRDA